MLTTKQIKQRYFRKKRASAPTVKCACGCGGKLKAVDHYGRPQQYINGHNGRKYEDPTQYKREWNHRNREQRHAYKTLRSHKLKATLIASRGGRCARCPYTYDGKNAAAFQFHHRDPKTKKFNVTVGAFQNRSLNELKAEAKKCDMLCANCHSVEHAGEY